MAIVKFTTSTKHGNKLENDKGFAAHRNRIYTKTADGSPITLSEHGAVQKHVNDKRNITPKQANQIKRANIQDSKYRGSNRAALQELKGRKRKKPKKQKKK